MLTVTEICRELDVTPRTVKRWQVSGCPHERDAGRILFDLDAVRAWREADEPPAPKRGRPKRVRGEDEPDTLADVQLRKERALAERHELAVEKQRGEVIELAVLRDELAATFYALRQRLNGVAPAVRQLLGDPAADLVEREIRSALDVLRSQWAAEVGP